MTSKISKILIANRGEIAIRISRAINELGLQSVGIYTHEDRVSLHRLKVNEAYQIGEGKGPVEAYLDINGILDIAEESGCHAVHPGYGFLSENPEFAEECAKRGLVFIGPKPEVMRGLGDKVQARKVAIAAGVPVIPATSPLSSSVKEINQAVKEIGLPVMLKASWGGGGRGMRVLREAGNVAQSVKIAQQEALAFFGKDDVYFEKLIEDARHIEVQILGDNAGNIIHLYERDCSLQRRHQKVIERAPAPHLEESIRDDMCAAAVKLCKHIGVNNAATVEFLLDAKTGKFYFIEVNPRVQVEHTITEEITGVDIVKAQISIAAGGVLGGGDPLLPGQEEIEIRGAAMQCRVTTEDPVNNFIPDYGRIMAYRSPAGPGVRLDGATSYAGAVVTRYYDSLLVKITTRGRDHNEVCERMGRALLEFRIRGVETNLPFLQHLISHPKFIDGSYNTQFIDTQGSLFEFPQKRDRSTKLLKFVGDVIVNANPEVIGRKTPSVLRYPEAPKGLGKKYPDGFKTLLKTKGVSAVVDAVKNRAAPLITDTSMRDAHQSLLATRLRTDDIVKIAPNYARSMSGLFSTESWGGATFDVSYRFLKEDPWERLQACSEAMPNILQQMLLRASNAVGYKNYPDNVVKGFIAQAAKSGVDVFRIFDSLNWVENMRLAIDSVNESGKISEAAICYTGDILSPNEKTYTINYYVDMAKKLEAAGAQILGVKDMAGLLKPAAARALFTALKSEVSLPIHFHTHDVSGISAASVLAAIDVGVDIVDAAMDSVSGLTSQPSLGSIVEALSHTPLDTGLNIDSIRSISGYWGKVRDNYAGFEHNIRAGASEVYIHEMPGGQYTNLKEQARSLGLEARWPEVAKTYAQVNDMFGNIVKVTPSSKVVGDMTLAMMTAGLSRADVENPKREIAFPDSVIAFFKGELGQPPNGFPKALQAKVLGGQKALTTRPGASMPAVDFDKERAFLKKTLGRSVSDEDLLSYLLYPNVFLDYCSHRRDFGKTAVLPTPVFFYGMKPGQEIKVELDKGRPAIIRFLALSEVDQDGKRHIFFELDGFSRSVTVIDRSANVTIVSNEKVDPANDHHIGAPMPGLVSAVEVSQGESVKAGQTLVVIEAMKMQSAIPAEHDGVVERIPAYVGQIVESKDLLCVISK